MIDVDLLVGRFRLGESTKTVNVCASNSSSSPCVFTATRSHNAFITALREQKEIPKVGLEQQKVRPADILQYPPLSSFLTLVLKGYMKGDRTEQPLTDHSILAGPSN